MIYDEQTEKQRCEECKFRKVVYAQNNYRFYGCYCEPYKGKMVSEIKECPKAGGKE